MSQKKLSALVVAHNEAHQLAACLERLAFCDEIIVVLDKCTDASRAVASQFTPHILEGSWDIEGERRNLGLEACTGDWVLEIDADERVMPELAALIKSHIQTAPAGWVLIPVQNYVGNHYIQHGWVHPVGTTKAKKLSSKGSKRWGNQRVHPSLNLVGIETEIGQHLTAGQGLVHHIDRDIADMAARINRYSTAMALDHIAQNKPAPWLANTLRRALSRFCKGYIRRKGYKEGAFGLLLAFMAAWCIVLTHFKIVIRHDPPHAQP